MIEVVNVQTETMFGYHRVEIVREPVKFLIPEQFREACPTDSRCDVADSRLHPMGTGRDLHGVAKDGRRSPVEISLSSVGTLDESLTSAAIRDIFERRRTETQSGTIQLELMHVTHLSTMGEMATGLAHELTLPIPAIIQFCDAALWTASSDDDVDPEFAEFLDEIQKQAHRAGEIIRRLRQFMRKGESEKSAVPVNQLVHQTVRLVEPDARDKNVQIIPDLADDPCIADLRARQATI